MQNIEWKKSFSVGIEEIDNQHKQLVKIINELYGKLSHNPSSVTLADIHKELKDYYNHHFETEEKYMLKFGFEHYKDHKSEHDSFRIQLNDLINNQSINIDKQIIEILNFLKDWLLNHIMDTDKEYIETFKSHGLK